ncbi:MAG: type II secretion system protein [Patescibacteria group bacterium]|jgi:prepilin-type N-terminal cleavage/methylation domain-containing protein
MYRLKTYERGFTLLELLIVIAVIAILASAVVANLGAARNKANDAKIRSELKAVDQAITVYTSTGKASDLAVTSWDTLMTKLSAAGLMAKRPVHPDAPTSNPSYGYYYTGTGTATLNYVLGGKLLAPSGDPCYVISNGAAQDAPCSGTLNGIQYAIQ